MFYSFTMKSIESEALERKHTARIVEECISQWAVLIQGSVWKPCAVQQNRARHRIQFIGLGGGVEGFKKH